MINNKKYILMLIIISCVIYFIRIPISILGYSIKSILLFDNNIDNEIIIGINADLEKENNDLRNIINLKEINYSFIPALVISRDFPWQNSITIDKGKNDNIITDMVVVGKYGFIGKIVDVYDNYSKVNLITDNSYKIGVSIFGSDEYFGIIDYYDSSDDFLIVTNINKDDDIKIGDKVYTNGVGGVYPSNIYIGDVYSIESDNLNLSKIIKVKFKDSLSNIKFVLVIGR